MIEAWGALTFFLAGALVGMLIETFARRRDVSRRALEDAVIALSSPAAYSEEYVRQCVHLAIELEAKR